MRQGTSAYAIQQQIYLAFPVWQKGKFERWHCHYYEEFATWVTVDYHPHRLEVHLEREHPTYSERVSITASQNAVGIGGASTAGSNLTFSCRSSWNPDQPLEVTVDFNPPKPSGEAGICALD